MNGNGKKGAERTGRASLPQAVFSCALALALACTGCAPISTSIGDDPTPLTEGEAAVESTEATAGEGADSTASAEGEAAYDSSKTLEDGTVVSSSDVDVNELDISVVMDGDAPAVEATSAAAAPANEGPAADEAAAEEPLATFAAVNALAAAAPATIGGLTVTGGVKDIDFKEVSGAIQVLTSTPLTFEGVSTTHSIQIAQGIKADVTLAGVTITKHTPFEVLTNRSGTGEGTYCHITLADGKVNVLNASATNSPGLRCGIGSTLVIDDANLNIKGGGSKLNPDDIITPQNGQVGWDGTTLSGVTVQAADDLSKLESKNPGTLKCAAGPYSAAIGGSPCENSGTLIFNGGTILAAGSNSAAAISNDNYNWETYWTKEQGTQHGGAGIGAGCMASGTLTIINGGNIKAKAAYHGSGIGGGYCNGDYHANAYGARNANAVVNSKAQIGSKSVAGDIIINGGYARSYASGHGNAFGQACCGTNSGKTITVTGGTLLPWSNSGYRDIGGAGGYVVITGGSIRLTGAQSGKPAPTGKFQSSDNKAYNAAGTEVFMFCIDLSTSDNIGTEPVASWQLLIGGKEYSYGAPAYFDAGKLYLWLPTTVVQDKSEVTVRLSKYDASGNVKPIEDLSAKPTDTTGTGLGKRWFNYQLTPEFKEENKGLFSKYYDGNSIVDLITALETYVDDPNKGLPAPYGANENAKLSDSSYLMYQSAPLKADGTLYEAYYPATASHDHDKLPNGSGNLAVRIQSEQYANDAATQASFWGHETTINVAISPVNSKTDFAPYTLAGAGADGADVAIDGPQWLQDENQNLNNAATNHLFVPVDVTSWTLPNGDTYPDGSNMSRPTCEAPFGVLQLYLDGEPIPARFGGTLTFTRADLTAGSDKLSIQKDKDGREHTIALFDLSRSQLEAFGLKDTGNDKHKVYVTYTSHRDGTTNIRPEAVDLAATVSAVPLFSRAALLSDTSAGVMAQADYAAQMSEAAGEPAPQADGADEGAASSVDGAYRNYYDSVTALTNVDIPMTDPKFDVYNFKGTGYDPAGTAKPTLSEDKKVQVVSYDITKDKGQFPLYVDTNSIGKVTFTSSNPDVISIEPGIVPNRADRFSEDDPTNEDFGFGVMANLSSPGKTTITVKMESTGAFNGAEQTFDVYVYPDPAAVPVVNATEICTNLTRNDGTIRPNDTLRYTATHANATANSSLQNPVFTLSVPEDTTFQSLTVTLPSGETRTLQEGKDFQMRRGVITCATLPALYGTQSYRFAMDVKVKSDVTARASDDPDFYSETTANGVYGIDPAHDAAYPWDTRIPADGKPVAEAEAWADPTSTDPAGPGDPTDPSNPSGPTDPSNPTDPTDPVNPDERDDHDLVVIPDDVDPQAPESDIKVTKTAENITPGAAERANQNIVQIGDTLRYTIKIENVKIGSAWYNGLVRDPLPQGIEPVSGSIKLKTAEGKTVAVDDKAYNPQTRVMALGLGDIYGGEAVELTFEAKVTNEAVGSPLVNTARAFGTNPTDRWNEEHPDDPVGPKPPADKPDDPDSPDAPDTPDVPDVPDTPDGPGPVTPELKPGEPYDPADGWDVFDEEVGTDPADPENPADSGFILPRDPDADDLTVRKVAESVDKHEGGVVKVGDVIRYTITVKNSGSGTMLYNAVVRDDVPRGLEPIEGTVHVTTAKGEEVKATGTGWDSRTGILSVYMGDLPGGATLTLVFDVKVTDGAVGGDIGNGATLYGDAPSDVNVDELVVDDPENPGQKVYDPENPGRPEVGSPWTPADGWKAWDDAGHKPLTETPEKAYPSDHARQHGVQGEGWRSMLRLPQTGDGMAMLLFGATLIAAAAVLVVLVARRHRAQ